MSEEISTILEGAALAQSVGDYRTALTQYQTALEILISQLRIEPKGTERHITLSQTINVYMTEAETIKARISAANNNASAPSSSEPAAKSPPAQAPSAAAPAQLKSSIPDNFDYSVPVKSKPAVRRSSTSPVKEKGKSSPTPKGKTSPTPKGDSQKLKATEEKLNEYETQIMEEMMEKSPSVKWDDIAGLAFAKQTLQEAVILPNLRPDLFVGLRAPPRGVLLFGPPGTGKTMLAKAVATESGFSFFSITPSSVTSKYLGEGEKLMKALFTVARSHQPSVIFFDEIDALLSVRKDNEHEASRRLKTEFMTQVDGASSNSEDRLLIMAATNIPWEIDEAVLRRLVKRIYVPLPDVPARASLVRHLLKKQQSNKPTGLVEKDIDEIVRLTEGYSASDLTALCRESAMGPIREMKPEMLRTVKAEELRPVTRKDFSDSLQIIRPSVSGEHLKSYIKWGEQYATIR